MQVKTHPVDFHLEYLGREKAVPLRLAREEWPNSIHEELKMAWISLKALGLLPLFVKQPTAFGARKMGALAVQAAYAVGFYLAFGAYAVDRAILVRDELLKSNKNILIDASMYLIILVPHMLIGPLQWAGMAHVLGFLRDWDAFQEYFQRVTRHALQLEMFWLSSITIVLAVASAMGATFILDILVLKGEMRDALYFMYGSIQLNVLLAVWVLLCLASAKSAGCLARRLKEDLAIPERISKDLISGYYSAWLRLSQLTNDIGDVFCHVFHVIMIFCLVEMLLSAFQGARLLVNGCPLTTFIGIGGLAINAFIYIHVFCYAAHYATDSVSKKIVKCLAEIQVVNTELRKQLHDLAQAVTTHGAVINLGGLYVVDRSLIVSVMSAFATFMVVLVQSTPETDASFCL